MIGIWYGGYCWCGIMVSKVGRLSGWVFRREEEGNGKRSPGDDMSRSKLNYG